MGFVFLVILLVCFGPVIALICWSQHVDHQSDYLRLKGKVRPPRGSIFF